MKNVCFHSITSHDTHIHTLISKVQKNPHSKHSINVWNTLRDSYLCGSRREYERFPYQAVTNSWVNFWRREWIPNRVPSSVIPKALFLWLWRYLEVKYGLRILYIWRFLITRNERESRFGEWKWSYLKRKKLEDNYEWDSKYDHQVSPLPSFFFSSFFHIPSSSFSFWFLLSSSAGSETCYFFVKHGLRWCGMMCRTTAV